MVTQGDTGTFLLPKRVGLLPHRMPKIKLLINRWDEPRHEASMPSGVRHL